MKNIQLLTSLLLATLVSFPLVSQKEIIREFYPNGKPKLYREVLNDQANGLWLEWYPNGHIRYRAQWKDNKGHGLWEYFHSNGQLRSKSVYDADIIQGISLEYHENGVLQREIIYVSGKREGRTNYFDANGQRIKTELYENGQRRIEVPEVFLPNIVSDPESEEFSITFSPGGERLYFTRRTKDDPAQKIYRSDNIDGQWTTPIIAEFSTDTDESPFITLDGQFLYFASYRSMDPNRMAPTRYDMNIWRASWNGKSFDNPQPLSENINKVMQLGEAWPNNYEAHPTLSPNGDLYYWSGSATGKDSDLYVAKKGGGKADFATSLAIKELNTERFESGATISPDGQIICFSAYGREDGFGGEDIYYARRQADGSWSEAVNLGPIINTQFQEGTPYFSPDGKYFYFTRGDGEQGVQSDVFVVETAFLQY